MSDVPPFVYNFNNEIFIDSFPWALPIQVSFNITYKIKVFLCLGKQVFGLKRLTLTHYSLEINFF